MCVQIPTHGEVAPFRREPCGPSRRTSGKRNAFKYLERLNLRAEAESRWDGYFRGSLERVVHIIKDGVSPSVKESEIVRPCTRCSTGAGSRFGCGYS
jgi:hypothetical protein